MMFLLHSSIGMDERKAHHLALVIVYTAGVFRPCEEKRRGLSDST